MHRTLRIMCLLAAAALSLFPAAAFSASAAAPVQKPLLARVRFVVGMAIAPAPVSGLRNQLFCVSYHAGLLYQVDPEQHTCTVISRDFTTPHGIAIHQSENGSVQEAYIAELKTGRIIKVDLLTGRQSVVAEGLQLPARLALLEKSGAVEAIFVTQLREGSVVRLARNGLQQWQPSVIATGIPMADGIELEPGGATALVGSFGGAGLLPGCATGQLTRIDLESGAVLGTPVSGGLLFPAQFALSNEPGEPLELFVSEMLGQRVTRFSCSAEGTCEQTGRFYGIMIPAAISLSPDKSRLFVAESFFGRIYSIDTATGDSELAARLPR